MNLYGFAGGDPVNFSDPFGLWPVVPGLGNFVSQSVFKGLLKAGEKRMEALAMDISMGVSAGLEEAGATAIERIAGTLTERFGEPTKAFTRSSGALQREWTNVKTGMKHLLAGPETHEISPGQGAVEHYNYEIQRPGAKPGKFEPVNNVHLDARGNPIDGKP